MWQASVHLNVVKNRSIGEEQAARDLKAAGMSQECIDVLCGLDRKYLVGFAKISDDPETVKKFNEDFHLEAKRFIEGMSESDKIIYKAHLKKHGIDK